MTDGSLPLYFQPQDGDKMDEELLVADATVGPAPCSTVLSAEGEAMMVAFRKHTLLPLDDGFYTLQASLSQLASIGASCSATASAATGSRWLPL